MGAHEEAVRGPLASLGDAHISRPTWSIPAPLVGGGMDQVAADTRCVHTVASRRGHQRHGVVSPGKAGELRTRRRRSI